MKYLDSAWITYCKINLLDSTNRINRHMFDAGAKAAMRLAAEHCEDYVDDLDRDYKELGFEIAEVLRSKAMICRYKG